LLELPLAEYEECFYIDKEAITEMLDEEQARLKTELKKA